MADFRPSRNNQNRSGRSGGRQRDRNTGKFGGRREEFRGKSEGFREKPGSFRGRDERPSRFGGGRGRNNDRNRSFDRGRSEMFEATCDECGKRCQLPFRPTGSKPVFCSDCFRQSEGGRSSNNNSNSQSGISSEQFNILNSKLDKILKVMQQLELEVDDEDSEDEESDDEQE